MAAMNLVIIEASSLSAQQREFNKTNLLNALRKNDKLRAENRNLRQRLEQMSAENRRFQFVEHERAETQTLLNEKDVAIRVLSQKVKVMTDLLEVWKKEKYQHLQDQHEKLLAEQLWAQNAQIQNVQTDGELESHDSHRHDPDPELMEEVERLKQNVVDLEHRLKCAQKESRKQSRRWTVKMEKVSADRDKLHVQNLRLQCDLKLRDSKIREFTDIFDRERSLHTAGVSSVGLHIPFTSMTLKCDGPGILCTETATCRSRGASPCVSPSYSMNSSTVFQFPPSAHEWCPM